MSCKTRYFYSLLFLIGAFFANAQSTDFTFTPASDTCNNNVVSFAASANTATTAATFNFNGGALPAGWSSSPYTISPTFCPGKNSPDNSNYFWATNLETTGPNVGKRYVQTNAVNVSLGGSISFYLRYAADEAPSAGCEDPDLPDEEVILQYSIDNGSSWITIYNQWDTVSDFSLPWYNWYAANLPIPAGAQTTSTIFRWYQPSNSGATTDNWGLEDINISATTAATVTSYDWTFGDATVGSGQNPTKTYAAPAAGTSVTYTVALGEFNNLTQQMIKFYLC